jgi:hypothetical protein
MCFLQEGKPRFAEIKVDFHETGNISFDFQGFGLMITPPIIFEATRWIGESDTSSDIV